MADRVGFSGSGATRSTLSLDRVRIDCRIGCFVPFDAESRHPVVIRSCLADWADVVAVASLLSAEGLYRRLEEFLNRLSELDDVLGTSNRVRPTPFKVGGVQVRSDVSAPLAHPWPRVHVHANRSLYLRASAATLRWPSQPTRDLSRSVCMLAPSASTGLPAKDSLVATCTPVGVSLKSHS